MGILKVAGTVQGSEIRWEEVGKVQTSSSRPDSQELLSDCLLLSPPTRDLIRFSVCASFSFWSTPAWLTMTENNYTTSQLSSVFNGKSFYRLTLSPFPALPSVSTRSIHRTGKKNPGGVPSLPNLKVCTAVKQRRCPLCPPLHPGTCLD